SPAWKLPLVILTVAEASVALSGSVTVSPGSTASGTGSPSSGSVKVVAPPLVVTVGASLTAVIFTVTLLGELVAPAPSFSVMRMVRGSIDGLVVLLLLYVRFLIKACTAAGVAVGRN